MFLFIFIKIYTKGEICKINKKFLFYHKHLFSHYFDFASDAQVRYQRAVADSENIRRRTQRCVEDAKIFGERFINNTF